MGERWNAARLIKAITKAGDGKRGLDRMLHELNADCDAYEKRIAELEANGVDRPCPACHHSREEVMRLRAELARVKAESLRVVEVAGADYCVWCDGSGSWLESEYESGGVCVGQIENTCIHCLGYRKPVRLERWETEE